MSGVLDSVLNELSQDQKAQLSQQLGVKTDDLERGMEAAVPVIIGGMERTSQDPAKAAALERAVQQQGIGSLEDILGGVLSAAAKGGAPGAGTPGGDILNDIFGNKRANVEQKLGKSAGIDPNVMAQLIKVLGPLVLSALAKQQTTKGSKAPDLGSVLKNERQQMEQRHPQGKTLLGMFLDQDGDGDFDLNDVLKLGFKFFSSGRRSP
jgi:hypothetical protein